MLANYLTKIKKFHKNKEHIDVLALARELRFNVKSVNLEPTCVGSVFYSNEEISLENNDSEELNYKKHIHINNNLTTIEKNTVLSLMISEFIIKHDKLIQQEKVELDIFSFKELRRNRFSRSIQLATRLIIPEKILFEFDDLKDHRETYAKKINVNFDLINCAVKDNSLEFLITNEMIWNTKINNF